MTSVGSRQREVRIFSPERMRKFLSTSTPVVMDMDAVLEVDLRAVPGNKKRGHVTHGWVTVDIASRVQCPPT